MKVDLAIRSTLSQCKVQQHQAMWHCVKTERTKVTRCLVLPRTRKGRCGNCERNAQHYSCASVTTRSTKS